MKNFVNQKVINGITYRAYREVTQDIKTKEKSVVAEYIERDGVYKEVKLKNVWDNDRKIEKLYEKVK